MKKSGIVLGSLLIAAVSLIVVNWAADRPSIVASVEAGPVERDTLAVDGMTCGGCAVSVNSALKGVAGVTECKVDVAEGKVVVTYKKGKVSKEQMMDAINSTGFKARKPSAG